MLFSEGSALFLVGADFASLHSQRKPKPPESLGLSGVPVRLEKPEMPLAGSVSHASAFSFSFRWLIRASPTSRIACGSANSGSWVIVIT